MISKSFQVKLATYFAGMICLHIFVAVNSARLIPQGVTDFSTLYTAGKILISGQKSLLYDAGLQLEIQRSFGPKGVQRRGSVLPYNHPPFEAIIFAPLAHFSYLTAYFVWLAFNLCLL